MQQEQKTRGGDNRLSNRREAFLEYGRALFLEKGFDATSLSDVVKAAGGSLATLYKLFGNKEGLLTAIVRDGPQSGRRTIDEVAAMDLGPADTLREIAFRLNQHFLDPETIRMWRIVIAQSIKDPEFGRRYFDDMLSETFDRLTAVFENIRAQGIALTDEPVVLTHIYLSIMVHDYQVEAIAAATPAQCTGTGIRQRVDFFLRGAGVQQ